MVCVKNVILSSKSCPHIVCVQDRKFSGCFYSLIAQHTDITVRDEQDRSRTIRSCGYRVLFCAGRHFHMTREERCQVILYTDRAHAGTTSAMRDRECFVQVQVANISADQ